MCMPQLTYEVPAVNAALTSHLPTALHATNLGQIGRILDHLRQSGATDADLAALAREIEISRRRRQFRVAEVNGLTITVHL